MNKIKEIKIDKNNWLEVVWTDKNNNQIHCESFSGHKEHIAKLRAISKDFNTSLEEFEPLIKQCEDAFIYPTNEEIELEKRKQFEIQFRFERDNLLKEADVAIYKTEDLGEDTKFLREYRQSLRSATIKWIMPESII